MSSNLVIGMQVLLLSFVLAHEARTLNPLLRAYKDNVIPYIIERDWNKVVGQVRQLLEQVEVADRRGKSPKYFPGLYPLAKDVDKKQNMQFYRKLQEAVKAGEGYQLVAILDQIFYYKMWESFREVEKLMKSTKGCPNKQIIDQFQQARDYFSAIFEERLKQQDGTKAWVESMDDALDGLLSDFRKGGRMDNQSLSQFIDGFLSKIRQFFLIPPIVKSEKNPKL